MTESNLTHRNNFWKQLINRTRNELGWKLFTKKIILAGPHRDLGYLKDSSTRRGHGSETSLKRNRLTKYTFCLEKCKAILSSSWHKPVYDENFEQFADILHIWVVLIKTLNQCLFHVWSLIWQNITRSKVNMSFWNARQL